MKKEQIQQIANKYILEAGIKESTLTTLAGPVCMNAFLVEFIPYLEAQTGEFKKAIEDSYQEGYDAAFHYEESQAEQYYNETFKKNLSFNILFVTKQN